MHAISLIWNKIQSTLFPMLEENLGPLTETQQKLVSVLEIVRVEEFIPRPCRGCSQGNSESQRKATEVLANYSPSAIIAVGIAFGTDPAKQALGDVLVSEAVFNYDLAPMPFS